MKTLCRITTTTQNVTGYLNQDDQGNLSISGQPVNPNSDFKGILITDTDAQIPDLKTLKDKFFSGELFSMQNVSVLMDANHVNNLTDLLTKLNIIPQQNIKQINVPKQIQMTNNNQVTNNVQNNNSINVTNNNQVTNNIQNNNSTSYAGSNTHHGATKYTQGEAPVTVLDRDNDLATRLKYELEKLNGFDLTKHPEIKIQSLSDGSINIYNGFSHLRVNRKDLDDRTCKSLIGCIKNKDIEMFGKMSSSYKGGEQYGYKQVRHGSIGINGEQESGCCPGGICVTF